MPTRCRPYPTKAAWAVHKARIERAEAEGRICPNHPGIEIYENGVCVVCKNMGLKGPTIEYYEPSPSERGLWHR